MVSPTFADHHFTYPLTNSLPWKITMLLMGKSTISMAIFNSKLLVYQRVVNKAPNFGCSSIFRPVATVALLGQEPAEEIPVSSG